MQKIPDNAVLILQHAGGAVVSFPIETIGRGYVSIRWGMNGVYDLYFKNNQLTARSVKARRRGPALWRAVNFDEVKRIHDEFWKPSAAKTKVDASYERHLATMPKATASK